MDARQRLFEGLIDYAGLFAPAQLDMGPAVAEYATLRAGERAWMLGRFIVPASRIFELCETIESRSEEEAVTAYPLSVIVDAGADDKSWLSKASSATAEIVRAQSEDHPVRVEVLEIPVPPLAAARDTYDSTVGQFGMVAQNAGLRQLPIYVEFPRDDAWTAVLASGMPVLGRAKFGAKLRCGGVTAQATPSSQEIASFLRCAFENNVAFKATAGLHHPIRQRDKATGVTMHGFLNLLAAEIRVRNGATDDELVGILDEEDPSAFGLTGADFSWRGETATAEQISVARRDGFRSYGSCSFEEPVEDLIRLGMLQPSGTPA
ncbi:MAG: hypothetical protein M3126_09020 [Candidatus Eremiobacteraeota bacterium]|nr:hypothetical protein [Candidatus Eremiobacteraeota bacterium]